MNQFVVNSEQSFAKLDIEIIPVEPYWNHGEEKEKEHYP